MGKDLPLLRDPAIPHKKKGISPVCKAQGLTLCILPKGCIYPGRKNLKKNLPKRKCDAAIGLQNTTIFSSERGKKAPEFLGIWRIVRHEACTDRKGGEHQGRAPDMIAVRV